MLIQALPEKATPRATEHVSFNGFNHRPSPSTLGSPLGQVTGSLPAHSALLKQMCVLKSVCPVEHSDQVCQSLLVRPCVRPCGMVLSRRSVRGEGKVARYSPETTDNHRAPERVIAQQIRPRRRDFLDNRFRCFSYGPSETRFPQCFLAKYHGLSQRTQPQFAPRARRFSELNKNRLVLGLQDQVRAFSVALVLGGCR